MQQPQPSVVHGLDLIIFTPMGTGELGGQQDRSQSLRTPGLRLRDELSTLLNPFLCQ
jgi:hypothetical protein